MAAQPQIVKSKIIHALSDAQKTYQAVLQKTLLAELEFLMDVVQGRIADRKSLDDTAKDKLIQGLGSILGMVPIIGSVLGPALSALGSQLLDKTTSQKKEAESQKLLQSFMSLNRAKLEIIAQDCAREITCRWEMAINRFVDKDKLVAFAAVGAIRIMKYLCDKHLPIERINLIQGIVAGRSGSQAAFVSGFFSKFFDTDIPIDKAMQAYWENLKTLTAEGLYGLPGYIVDGRFYIHDVSQGRTLDKIKEKRKAKRDPLELHYGYVKVLESPKFATEVSRTAYSLVLV